MTIKSIWLAAFVVSLCVLACGIAFQVSSARHWTAPPGGLPYGLKNAVLAMELAREPWPTAMLQPAGNQAEMSHQQYIDYFYIPSYTALFILIAILQSGSEKRWVAALGPVCILLILVAANYDLIENRAILGVTEHNDASAWADIRPASLIKWTCAFLVILLEAAFYMTVPRVKILARILGVASILAGLIGTYASTAGNEKGLESATLPLLVSMLAMPVFLWMSARATGRS